MDAQLLSDMNLKPTVHGRALLRDYELRIGERATLVPKTGAIAYGMMIELSDSDLTTLYSAPGVKDYEPIAVNTENMDDGSHCEAVCFNLAPDQLGATPNSDYAKKLTALLLSLGFPEH